MARNSRGAVLWRTMAYQHGCFCSRYGALSFRPVLLNITELYLGCCMNCCSHFLSKTRIVIG
jgi:hypothetical protein